MKKNLCVILLIFLCFLLPQKAAEAKENLNYDNGQPLSEEENREEETLENSMESAEEEEIIYVGWYQRDGYFEKNSEGILSGFGYDYLMAISSYTGWKYKFVEGTRKECMTWLREGEVDLVSPVNVYLNRYNIQVAREVIGEDYGYLYKRNNNSSIKYEDFSNFNKATLGITTDSGMEQRLEEYCRDHGFQFHEIIFYNTIEEMKQGLGEGEIDLLLADAYVNMQNMKVVGRFSNGRATFASNDFKIIEQLNYAMEEIKLNNPEFTMDLEETYFSKSSHNNLEYSAEEGEYLEEGDSYDLILCEQQYPISYSEDGGRTRKGMAVELLERIQYQTGLNFNISYEDTYREGMTKLERGDVLILGGGIVRKQDSEVLNGEFFGEDREKKKYNVGFYNVRLGIVGKKTIDTQSRLNIAIPDYLEEAKSGLKDLYPHYNFISYKNSETCMEVVAAQAVDGAILSDVAIQELLMHEVYKDLQIIQNVPGNYTAVFTIYTEDKVLVDIIRKAIHNIPETTVASIENENIYHLTMRPMNLEEFWNEYRSVILMAVTVLIAVTSFWKYFSEKQEKEKAYRDSVADVGSMEKLRLDFAPILDSPWKEEYFVIAVDIDRFKIINDLYGYDMGDKTIAFLGRCLKSNLGSHDFIARSNADNFVILKKAETEEEVSKYVEKVYGDIDEFIHRNTIHYHLIIKSGIYRITGTDHNLSNIIDKANLAKLGICQVYKSSFRFYNEEMRSKNIEEKQLENDMEEALNNGEFCVYLQPQIDLDTNKIVSAEALVRWNSPKKGMISPAKFIPVFEKNGFVTRLDYFVWEEAMKTIRKWKDKNQKVVPIAINLSRIDVQTEGMLEALISLREKYCLEGNCIKTELTESVCLESDRIIMDKMNQLKEAGFTIAIDDFGSGYSSFYLLKEMPIHILKIDKSFLEFDLSKESKHMVVLKDVINLGKHLNLQIIMEGVETKEQAGFLKAIGCDIAQGYYYSKPVSIDEFEILLKQQEEGGNRGCV